MSVLRKLKNIVSKLINSSSVEKFQSRHDLGFSLAKDLPQNFKIGFAVLSWERAEYLEKCLDSLFATNLHDYDITFLINDDGSTDPKVKEIIERPRDPKYKIIRNFTSKGHNSWAGGFNKAVKKLLEIDDFDIIGTCDSDALFHPEWLDQTLRIAIWAKANHRDHILGPFSSFNSSDFEFHHILGTYQSPSGNYVVKERMGALNYMYFTADFLKLGYYPESKDDETLMTKKFKRLKVRYFCTETSYVEHIGQVSVLNQFRPTPVANAVHAMNPAKDGWNYLDFRPHPESYYVNYEAEYHRYVFNINLHNQLTFRQRIANLNINILRKINEKYNPGYIYRSTRDWANRILRNTQQTYGIDVFIGLRSDSVSLESLDIIIPAIERDIQTLGLAIDSLRLNLKHPIDQIKIVGPKSDVLQDLANQKQCIYVNEDEVLPIKLADIDYVADGKDRSGWIFQQLLKFAGSAISDKPNYLVWDADTIMVRPQAFIVDGKTVFDMSNEYHTTYFQTYSALLNEPAFPPFSFVSHHMLINQQVLAELKSHIEKQNAKYWYTAIIDKADRSNSSGFSEYETYGNYFFLHHDKEMIMEYWYNASLKKKELSILDNLVRKYAQKYKSVSFQYYNS